MQVDCPYCHRTLDFSGDPPSFCAYCGKALTDLKLQSTAPFDPEAATLAPVEPGDGAARVPDSVGGYRLVRSLGVGGMGTVYEAEDVASGRHVALKLISPNFVASKGAVERFRQEGRLASMIAHPRCVFVLAAEEEVGRPYIVMELMSGSTLQDLVKERGPLPQEEAVKKILDVIEGLQEAHRQGVVHRDVKPSNCFLEPDGRVKVGDFGLAKSLVSDSHLTTTGSFMGTPLFASPEQVKAERVDQQTDVYSVSATLYFLLTGRPPYQAGDAAATVARIVSDQAPSMRTLRPELSRGLDEVVLRGLERDRKRRWRDLTALQTALFPFVPGNLTGVGMGKRIAAYLIDQILVNVASIPLALALFGTRKGLDDIRAGDARFVVAILCSAALHVFYYSLLEGVWGRSLGKRWLGLRVTPVTGSDPPGVGRALLRTVLFFALLTIGSNILKTISFFSAEPEHFLRYQAGEHIRIDFEGVLDVCGLVVLFSTMRARNGYRGLHELLSGTRVVQLQRPRKPRTFRGHRLDQEVLQPAGLPEQIGSYRIRGTLGGGPEARVLLGEDPKLGRKVWIWLRPVSPPPLGHGRHETDRGSRLRWLACGKHEGMQWDAFLAPGSGYTLTQLVQAGGPLAWAEARITLEQVTDELVHAIKDGTLPVLLTVDQVWIQPEGPVLLLDMPSAGRGLDAFEPGIPDDEKALAYLGNIAVFALEARLRAPDASGPVRAPVPRHAYSLINQLLDREHSFQNVEAFQTALTGIHDRPAEIGLWRRAAHLILIGCICQAILWIPIMLGLSFETNGEGSLRISDNFFPLIAMISVMAGISVLAAVLTGGGVFYPLLKIALIHEDGRKASRKQCAYRTALFWAPMIGLLGVAGWLHNRFGLAAWFDVAESLAFAGLVLTYVILALWSPSQSLHDRLANTRLVPK
jgi:uncharacterized RDD family membrane protein YckC